MRRLLLASRQPDGTVVGDDFKRPEYVKIDQSDAPAEHYHAGPDQGGSPAARRSCSATDNALPACTLRAYATSP